MKQHDGARRFIGIAVGVFCLWMAGCGTLASKARPGEAEMTLASPASPPAEVALGEPAAKPTERDAVKTAAATVTPAAATGQRQMIYTATLQIVVADVSSSLKSVQQNAESMGGYLQVLTSDTVTVRVPAARLQEAIAAAEKLGEVTGRDIRGQDITEEMTDVQIRLDTALQMRQRLLTLLEKADETADAIKVEEELGRVIQMIEQLKGKIRFYESQIALSTLTVKCNSPLPQQTSEQRVPFAWVRALGDGMLGANTHRYAVEGAARHGPRFDLPVSYIRYFGADDLAEAMSGNEVYIKVQRNENYQGGTLDFWSALARRTLVESRSIALQKDTALTLRSRATARLFTGSRQIAGKPFGYLLAVVADKHEVYAFEAWGPAEAFEKDRPALLKAVQSLDVDP